MFHLFAIENPNDRVGFFGLQANGVDEEGFTIDQNNWVVYVRTAVGPNSNAVIFGHGAGSGWGFDIGDSVNGRYYPLLYREDWGDLVAPYDWVINTEQLKTWNLQIVDDIDSSFKVLQGGSRAGGPVKIDLNNNEFFTLDGSWMTNRTDASLDLRYMCEYTRSLATMIQEIEEPLRPTFQKLSHITDYRVGNRGSVLIDHMERVESRALQVDGTTRDDGTKISCHSWSK